jgi:hypothetical protein
MDERKMLWIEDGVHSLFTPEAKRESSNVQGKTRGGSAVDTRYLVVYWHWRSFDQASSGTEGLAEQPAARTGGRPGGAKSLAMTKDGFFRAKADTHDFGRMVSRPLVVPLVFAFWCFVHCLAFWNWQSPVWGSTGGTTS